MKTWLVNLLDQFRSTRSRTRGITRLRRSRPRVEALEERTLLTAGALDSTFGVNGQVVTDIQTIANAGDNGANAVVVQADGKVIVGGSTTQAPGRSDFLIVRYNTDGSLDQTFGVGGHAQVDFGGLDTCRSVALVGSQIVVAGDNGTSFAVARLNADGSLDSTFGTGGKTLVDFGGAQEVCNGITVMGSQLLLAGGTVNGPRGDFAVARLNTDGSLDASFGTSGKVLIDFAASLRDVAFGVVATGTQLVVTGFSGTQGAVARLNANGSLDMSFDSDGKLLIGSTGALTDVMADGTGILVVDSTQILRLNADGSTDTTFGTAGSVVIGGGPAGLNFSHLARIGADILVSGYTFQGVGTVVSHFAAARLHANGSLDTTFGTGGIQLIDFGSASRAEAVALAGTQLVLAGAIDAGVNGSDVAVARLNADGSLDSAFDGDGLTTTDCPFIAAVPSRATAVAVQADGKIVAAGVSMTTDGDFAVERFNADGSPDVTFGVNGRVVVDFGGAVDTVSAVAIASTQIIVAGTSGTSPTSDFAVVRLNADGSLDSSFGTDGKVLIDFGSGADTCFGVAVEGTQIILVGQSMQGNAATSAAIARLNADGSLDSSFAGGGKLTFNTADGNTANFDLATSVAVTGDKIVVALTPARSPFAYDFAVARLNDDGSFDTSFGTGGQFVDLGGTSVGPASLALAGTQLVVGSRTTVARLNGNGTLDTGFGTGGKVVVNFGGTNDTIASVAAAGTQIVVAGAATQSGLGLGFGLARLNASGALDASFGTGGKVITQFSTANDSAAAVAVQADGRIVAVGFAPSSLANGTGFALARYLADSAPVTPAFSLAPLAIPDWTAGLAGYFQTITASHGTGPYALALTAGSLPPGMALDEATGRLTGTPTTVGTFTFTITATDSLGASASRAYAIGVGAERADHLVVSAPATAVAGSSVKVTVTALNSAGEVDVTYLGTVPLFFDPASGGGGNAYTFTPADRGSHTFTVPVSVVGTNTITAAGNRGVGSASTTLDVTPGAAIKFVVTGFDFGTSAGVERSVTITAFDTFGNRATGYQGTVHFTGTDSQALLPADYTFTTADAGVHTFNVTLNSLGTQSLTVTATANQFLKGTLSGITVTLAKSFTIDGLSAAFVLGGSPQTITVTVRDATGAVATGYLGTIHFSGSAPATLPLDYTFTAADAGVHSFDVTFRTGGSQSLTIWDKAAQFALSTRDGINVIAPVPNGFAVALPTTVTAGAAQSVTVIAFDADGNIATGYRGTVHISSSDGSAALPGNYTFKAGDAGVHTFTVKFKTAGTQSLSVVDIHTATNLSTGSTTVVAAAAKKLVLDGLPASTVADETQSVTVTLRDAFGNIATGYTGTVRFTSGDAQADLPAEYTFTAADAGAHTFTVAFKTAGRQSLTVTDAVDGTLKARQGNISVTPAAASTFLLTGFTTAATAGVAQNLSVTALDAFGNRVTDYVGTVHFSSSDTQAGLPTNFQFAAADRGKHTFRVTLKTAGLQNITVTDAAASSVIATRAGITVKPAAPRILVVGGFPSPTLAGAAQTFTVTARDAFGNTATNYTGTVQFRSTDAQAELPADYTFTAADGGRRTFTATLRTVGTQSLRGTDSNKRSITGVQDGILVVLM